MTRRIRLADQFGHADTEAQGGVHRHRDPDEPRLPDPLQINLLDRDVQTCRRVSCLLKEPHRQGDSDQQVWTSRSRRDRKSTRLNSSHLVISYAVFCLKKKKNKCEIQHRLYDPDREDLQAMSVLQSDVDTQKTTLLRPARNDQRLLA